MGKYEIRNVIRELKKNIIPLVAEDSTLENNIISKVESLPQFKNCNNLLLYNSLPDEFPTNNALCRWSKHLNIYLPKVNGKNLDIIRYAPDKIMSGAFGISEPTNIEDKISPSMLDIIIVPAVAFDTNGNRLGRGKGYYDKLLGNSGALRIGIGYDFQILDILPTDNHDIRMNYIFTPTYSIHIY